MPHDGFFSLKQRDHHAVCLTCKKKHLIAKTDDIDDVAWNDWLLKHPAPAHQTLVMADARLGELDGLAHNADAKTAYGSSAAYTITVASLASSLTAGRQSTVVSNTSNLYLDYLIGGKITVGTTPTTNTQIEVWGFGSVDDTPTYPDSLGASDAAYTATSAAIKQAALRLLALMAVDSATSNRTYWLAPTSLAQAFGGFIPKNHGLAVFHNTAVALHATGGNHALSYTPVYATVS